MTQLEEAINQRATRDGGEFKGYLTPCEIEEAGLTLVRVNNKPVSFRSMLKQRQYFRIDNTVTGEGRIVKGREAEQVTDKPVFLIPSHSS